MPNQKQVVRFIFTFLVLFSLVPLTHNLMYKESVSWRGPKYIFIPYGYQGINYANFLDPLRVYETENNGYLGIFSDDGYTLLSRADKLSNWQETQSIGMIFVDNVSNWLYPGIYELNRLNNGSFMLGAIGDSYQSNRYIGFIQSTDGINWINGFAVNVTVYEFFKTGYNYYNFNFFQQNEEIKVFTSYVISDIDENGTSELGISVWNMERNLVGNVTVISLIKESNITFYSDKIFIADDYAVDNKHFLLSSRNYTDNRIEGIVLTYEDKNWSQIRFFQDINTKHILYSTGINKLLIHNNQLSVIYSDIYGLNLNRWVQDSYFAHIEELAFDSLNSSAYISKIKRVGLTDEGSSAITVVRNSLSNKLIIKDRPHKVNYPFDPPPPSNLAYYEEKYDFSQSAKFSFSFIAIVVASVLPYRRFIIKEIKAFWRIKKAQRTQIKD